MVFMGSKIRTLKALAKMVYFRQFHCRLSRVATYTFNEIKMAALLE